MTFVSEQQALQLALIVMKNSVACSDMLIVVRKTRKQNFKDDRIIPDNMGVRLIVVVTVAVCLVLEVMEMTVNSPVYNIAEEEQQIKKDNSFVCVAEELF